MRLFEVIDKKTNKPIDMEQYVLDRPELELAYSDMETVGIGQEGQLYLIDECGCYEYLDENDFEIKWTKEE